ncbi:hypothetical protein P4117_31090 [Pseudomonas aeruginosa]|nr:hypothetical protein [Pseudomonas aeruginosa]
MISLIVISRQDDLDVFGAARVLEVACLGVDKSISLELHLSLFTALQPVRLILKGLLLALLPSLSRADTDTGSRSTLIALNVPAGPPVSVLTPYIAGATDDRTGNLDHPICGVCRNGGDAEK